MCVMPALVRGSAPFTNRGVAQPGSTWFGTQWKFTDLASFSFQNPPKNLLWLVPNLSPSGKDVLFCDCFRMLFWSRKCPSC